MRRFGWCPPVPDELGPTAYTGSPVLREESSKVTVNLNGSVDAAENQSLTEPLIGDLQVGTNTFQLNVESLGREARQTRSPKVKVEVWVKGDPSAILFVCGR